MSCIVADAGPLIALAKLGLLELPARAFGRALVPRSVYDECLAEARHGDAELIRIAAESGFILVSADLPWPVSLPMPRLDGGELAALALALAQAAPVLMDEASGRAAAARLGVQVFGVCGLLLIAKREGWIQRVAPHLDELRARNYFISPALRQQVLIMAGES